MAVGKYGGERPAQGRIAVELQVNQAAQPQRGWNGAAQLVALEVELL